MIVYRLRNIFSSRRLQALRAAHSAAKTQSEIEPVTKEDEKLVKRLVALLWHLWKTTVLFPKFQSS